MLTEIERLTAQWWFDPTLSVGLGLLTWVIGGLFTYWLFHRDQKLRLAEQLRDFAVRARNIRATLKGDDDDHIVILKYELSNLEKNLKFAEYGVRIEKILDCGTVFLEKAEVQLRATRHFDAKYNEFLDALRSGIRKLGWGGRYREMMRQLQQMKQVKLQEQPVKAGWFAPKPSIQTTTYHATLIEDDQGQAATPPSARQTTEFVARG